MLEIYVDPRRTANFKQAVIEAIEDGEYESLSDDIRDCFSDDQVEEIEGVLETGDIEETIDEIISEWNGDSLDDLLDGMYTAFADSSIELHFEDDDLELEDEEVDDFDDDFEDGEDVDEDTDDSEDADEEDEEEEEYEEDQDDEDY